jgi:hypothetical protein
MESVKFPGSPGTPLFPLSPERVNGTRPPYGGHVPQSPSLPEFGKPSLGGEPFSMNTRSPGRSPYRHSRNNSDAVVQGMIARFDNMSIKDFRANHEVAMKRVEIAREMAEMESSKLREQLEAKDADSKKMREELRKLKKELEESRERERKVAKRLDVTMVRRDLALIPLLMIYRRLPINPRTRTNTSLPRWKRNVASYEKMHSNPRLPWSNCRRSSRRRGVP